MPDTVAYLGLGLVVGLGLIALYIGSLYIRFKNINRDIEMLHQLSD